MTQVGHVFCLCCNVHLVQPSTYLPLQRSLIHLGHLARRILHPYRLNLYLLVGQQWNINNNGQIINLQFPWFCNDHLLWLLLKDCHVLFTVCHTPLALWLKRFITVSISKLCPEALCTLVPTPNCRGQMSQMENDLGNNLTHFTTDLCIQCGRWSNILSTFKQICLLTGSTHYRFS